MSLGLLFWLLMVLVLVVGSWLGYTRPGDRYTPGVSVLCWVLLALLGWRVFGPAPTGG